MNLCKDCKFFLLADKIEDLELGHCGYQRPISPVTGEPLRLSDLPYCAAQRRANGMCGVMGDNFRRAEV